MISELVKRYDIPVGFSDHSGTVEAILAAVALGAKLVEFHVVFDRCQFGPDSTSSLEIRELGKLVRGVRFISEALASPIRRKNCTSGLNPRSAFCNLRGGICAICTRRGCTNSLMMRSYDR